MSAKSEAPAGALPGRSHGIIWGVANCARNDDGNCMERVQLLWIREHLLQEAMLPEDLTPFLVAAILSRWSFLNPVVSKCFLACRVPCMQNLFVQCLDHPCASALAVVSCTRPQSPCCVCMQWYVAAGPNHPVACALACSRILQQYLVTLCAFAGFFCLDACESSSQKPLITDAPVLLQKSLAQIHPHAYAITSAYTPIHALPHNQASLLK
eukprot:1161491-Pelagomonas_calceolata.AAC.11